MITDQGVAVPEDMAQALAADPRVLEVFGGMRHGRQREWVEWIERSDGPLQRAGRIRELPDRVLSDPGAGPAR